MVGEAIADSIAKPTPRELDAEAGLVQRAKERSADAWTDIYEQHQPRLFRYVLARVGDRETAEDLTATVFLEAIKSIDSYVSRGRPLLAWLYTIARNVVTYHHRSQFRKRAAREAAGVLPGPLLSLLARRSPERAADRPAAEPPAEGADPGTLVEGWDLRRAISRLSADQREVIILRHFVGLTTPEVARVVGKHERAVYSLQARAIKALRRHLG